MLYPPGWDCSSFTPEFCRLHCCFDCACELWMNVPYDCTPTVTMWSLVTMWCTRASIWRKPTGETSIAGGRPRLLPGRVANPNAAGGQRASERLVGTARNILVSELQRVASIECRSQVVLGKNQAANSELEKLGPRIVPTSAVWNLPRSLHDHCARTFKVECRTLWTSRFWRLVDGSGAIEYAGPNLHACMHAWWWIRQHRSGGDEDDRLKRSSSNLRTKMHTSLGEGRVIRVHEREDGERCWQHSGKAFVKFDTGANVLHIAGL